MQKIEPIKLDKETTDGTVRNLDALYQLFPSCFTEAPDALGKVHRAVDWGKLRSLLGEYVEDGEPEKYDFTWVGKRAAQREAAAPCRKTVRPCPEESVDWDTTQNLYIEGDNLEVLKLLQNSYMGKVKMIYIDPPYNTGNDFVYHDDFHRTQKEEDEAAGVINEEGQRMVKNTESNGKFHSDWCSMIYSRLMIARSLLTEDGVIFISIDDNEQKNLRNICDEVFGESNFIGGLIHQRAKGGGQAKYIVKGHDYICVYAKTINNVSLSRKKVVQQKTIVINGEEYIKNDDVIRKTFGKYDKALGDRRCFYEELIKYKGPQKKQEIDEELNKGTLFLEENSYGMHTICRYEKVADATSKLYSIIKVLSEEGKKDIEKLGVTEFSYPKPVELLRQLIETGDKNMLVLDFFSGSSTTAQAVMEQNSVDEGNRKFIMIQYPEATEGRFCNLCEIGKERIRRAGKKIKEEHPEAKDLDIGFRVFKCDESNYKNVAFAPKDYKQGELDMLLDNIKEERTGLDLLFDCMLRWGLELSLPYTEQKVDKCTIYDVDEGNLVACFDGEVTEAVIDAIAQANPVRVVFRDSSFTEAAQKMNLFELFKQKCNWTDQEVKNNVRVI